MQVVVNLEGDRKGEILGAFVRSEEDAVFYLVPGLDQSGEQETKMAPADCVEIREVTDEAIRGRFARFAQMIESDATWVGGDTTVALNSLVGAAVEMIAYANVMGAALSVETATADLQRRIESGGYRLGSMAHSAELAA